MALVLYQHPFASYCQKVLIALYELGLPFETHLVEGEEGRAALARLWPLAGMPVLRDEDAGLTLPESTTIIEYLDGLAGGHALIPAAPGAALQARLWGRIADQHLSTPMQKIVGDELRPEGGRDPEGGAAARAPLDTAHALPDARPAHRPGAGGPRLRGAGSGGARPRGGPRPPPPMPCGPSGSPTGGGGAARASGWPTAPPSRRSSTCGRSIAGTPRRTRT